MSPIERTIDGGIVLVKQQGAMRTGTNLVKFALEENFTNVRVLVNIGRWKHALADVPFTWNGESWEAEGRNIDVSTRITADELSAVRAAVEAGTVRYAVSVRNVYTWLVSYLRFEHWYDDPPLHDLADLDDAEIIAAVRRWNLLYRSYLDLLPNEPSSMVFRLEDLRTAFGATLDRCHLLWGLHRRHGSYVAPQRYLRAGIDGQSRSRLLESAPVDWKSYRPDVQPGELHGPVLDLVRDTIDEHVVRAYGYDVI
jgi:hypothetical protein